jgi:hypothetical protein
MKLWVILFIFEILPIILWALSWFFENKASKYPDIKNGYRTKMSRINEKTWEYGNKVASKIYNYTANILFIVIAITIMFLKINLVSLVFIIFIVLLADYFIIEGLIKKKFKL